MANTNAGKYDDANIDLIVKTLRSRATAMSEFYRRHGARHDQPLEDISAELIEHLKSLADLMAADANQVRQHLRALVKWTDHVDPGERAAALEALKQEPTELPGLLNAIRREVAVKAFVAGFAQPNDYGYPPGIENYAEEYAKTQYPAGTAHVNFR